jgi:hypothetical protein
MDQVETLLRERSAGLRRTRSALRDEAIVLTSPVVQHTLPPPEEPAVSGSCADCGGSIPAGRLRAIPTAVRCACCQLELESRSI